MQMGMPGKQGDVDDKAGLQRETTTPRFELPVSTTHLKSCFIYNQVKEGCKKNRKSRNFLNIGTKIWPAWTEAGAVCPPKVPGLQKPIYPSLERGLCSGTAWEREEIQAGQMVGRKQLPTAAGSSKNLRKSSQNTATSNSGMGKEETCSLGRKRRWEWARFAKDNELKNHLVGFSDPSALAPLENQ